jgi:hypothetical protein
VSDASDPVSASKEFLVTFHVLSYASLALGLALYWLIR